MTPQNDVAIRLEFTLAYPKDGTVAQPFYGRTTKKLSVQRPMSACPVFF